MRRGGGSREGVGGEGRKAELLKWGWMREEGGGKREVEGDWGEEKGFFRRRR